MCISKMRINKMCSKETKSPWHIPGIRDQTPEGNQVAGEDRNAYSFSKEKNSVGVFIFSLVL